VNRAAECKPDGKVFVVTRAARGQGAAVAEG
jgi:hypothetical protein